MNFRVLLSDDLSAFRALRLRGLKEMPEAFGSTCEEFEQLTRAQLLEIMLPQGAPDEKFVMGVFDEENILLGIAGLKRESLAKIHHRAVIWGVYVSPTAQGKGVGKKLMLALFEQARKIPNLEQLHLTVVTSCVAARRMYTSLGFRSYGIERNAMKYNGIYYDEELMSYPLYPVYFD
jgi:RimJ/RimL family protein N-acetyltransferase